MTEIVAALMLMIQRLSSRLLASTELYSVKLQM